MIRRVFLPALLALALGGCQPVSPSNSASSGNANASPPVMTPDAAPRKPLAEQSASKTPVKDAIEALLEKEAKRKYSPFPKGTKLRSVSLEDGVATMDFSAEFNQLANSGESVESEAQKAICRTLQTIPGVEKARVTVEGHSFDSQATDWNTPFSIHFPGADKNEETAHGSDANLNVH